MRAHHVETVREHSFNELPAQLIVESGGGRSEDPMMVGAVESSYSQEVVDHLGDIVGIVEGGVTDLEGAYVRSRDGSTVPHLDL